MCDTLFIFFIIIFFQHLEWRNIVNSHDMSRRITANTITAIFAGLAKMPEMVVFIANKFTNFGTNANRMMGFLFHNSPHYSQMQTNGIDSMVQISCNFYRF